MNNMKKSVRRIFWLLALCFFLLLGYLGKLVIVDRAEISGNSYNIRLRNDEEGIQRGDILDRNGEVLATSTLQEDGSYLREYPRGRMVAHVTGYSSVGKTGVEAAYNFELMSVHQELLQRLSGLLEGKDPKGNDVVLTLDMDIQSAAGDLLGSTKGAVVVMEPSTGRILAMQAYPDFDPNTVSGDWDYLTTDEDSPAYIERVSVSTPAQVTAAKRAIKKAFEIQKQGLGFTFIEVVSSCPTNWGLTPVKAMEFVREKMIPYYPLGVFKDITAEEGK